MSTSPSSHIVGLLEKAVLRGASDLHLVTGYPPSLRIHGELQELQTELLDAESLRGELLSLCDEDTAAEFNRDCNVDFAYEHPFATELIRFRANYFMASDGPGACFRVIPNQIPNFDWAGFPEDLAVRLSEIRNGLVLLSGMTGAGKTTTLAMLVDLMNSRGGYRIVTIEDPIEYRYVRKSSTIVTQRETGRDVDSFASGLKYALRQDPDVILVGEIRDRETAQMALSAAETGHLVLSTLHTRDAKGAISRFADLFPQSNQAEVRAQLAMSLRAVISQHLVPSAFQDRRMLALEIMINNNPIASAIRTGKLETIDTGIVTGRSEGMISLDESLRRLLSDGSISHETAIRYASNPSIFAR